MSSSPQKPRRVRSVFIVVLVCVLGLAGFVLLNRLAIYDWLRLRSYQPPAAIITLANDDTMTASAKHIYYVNHPQLETKAMFAPNCPNGTEQTVVLGCYHSNQRGIYLLQVSNSELAGIEQVTAAHEMLHAAYDRLSTKQRTQVDSMLEAYYQHGLTDQTIKNTIAEYKKTEPHDVVNEMHSVFGTEVANLPAPLESYYKRYFADRAAITGYYATYEAAFDSRQAQIKQDDGELTTWHAEIHSQESDLTTKQTSLSAQQAELKQDQANGDIAAYNSQVVTYNQAVDAYNAEVNGLHTLIDQYNRLVVARNAIALEEQQLVQAISSPTTTMQ